MVKAETTDKNIVVNILAQSFDDNKSVNYIVKQDKSRRQRITELMSYSFDYCRLFGEVYLSDDKKACALVVIPEKKKTSLKSILLDVRLAVSCIGISNLKKALKREGTIKSLHPKTGMYYLWFIGVEASEYHRGRGSALLKEIITRADSLNRQIYLETSTVKNIPWYKKFGFETYEELDFGFKLFCLRRVNE